MELGQSLGLGTPAFVPAVCTSLGHGQQSLQSEDGRGSAAEFGGS